MTDFRESAAGQTLEKGKSAAADFVYSKYAVTASERRMERFFEVFPGLCSWTVLAGMTVLTFVNPLLAAILIIIFDFYWVLRLFYMTFFLLVSYGRLSAEAAIDWNARVCGIDAALAQAANHEDFDTQSSLSQSERKIIRRLVQSGAQPPRLEEIYHAVIFPVFSESAEIIESALNGLLGNNFPSSRMVVVIALEEAAGAGLRGAIEAVCAGKRSLFHHLVVVVHPQGRQGEARVKGANTTCAAQYLAGYFQESEIEYERVIVSCFDADTIVSRQYFSCLTYHYMMSARRTRCSFQPIPVYHNNIWEVPSFARVLEAGASFFQLVEATNPEKLVTFSSHSMSFQALVEVGYWPTDMISDDSAIFWKAYIHYEGDYRVVPIYVTVSMDVANSGTWWKTAVNVYKQKRRWAWGIENFPIVMRAFLKKNKIPKVDRFRMAFKMFEGHLAWATWPFLLVVIGWFPAVFAAAEFSNSVLFYSSQRITSIIFSLAWVALWMTIVISLLMLPKKKTKFPLWKRVRHAIEWLLIPVYGIFFSAMPALDAQTRLMLGKHMEFWVTEKKRGPS